MGKENSWDIDAIAQALRAETEACYHPQDGKGITFHVGLSYTHLDTWPQIGRIHVRSSSLTADLYRMTNVGFVDDNVFWWGGKEGSFRHLSVYSNGSLLITYPESLDRSLVIPPTTKNARLRGRRVP